MSLVRVVEIHLCFFGIANSFRDGAGSVVRCCQTFFSVIFGVLVSWLRWAIRHVQIICSVTG